MTQPSSQDAHAVSKSEDVIQFQRQKAGLASVQVWEYDAATTQTVDDVAARTKIALQRPDDFPPIDAALVPGDQVAIAVDPNVPQVAAVVRGAIELLRATPAEKIEIVVWDEATDETMDSIRGIAGECHVVRHQSDDRESLCYLAADELAAPIYLNRVLVDADFVLPIIAMRPADVGNRRDLTGVFPDLADSATRTNFADKILSGVDRKVNSKTGNTIAQEVPWLLGIQLIVAVTANAKGEAGEIHAGTVEAIAKRITPTLRRPDPVPPPAQLVVAALDGNQQQQTWQNVVRAAIAAQAYAEPEATIVIWSSLKDLPTGDLLRIDDEHAVDQGASDQGVSDGLPAWNDSRALAIGLKSVLANHRVILHSQLSSDVIEPLGMGVIQSAVELANLSRNFESCGVLRAAQFAGGH